MSKQLSNAAAKIFDDQVKLAYQNLKSQLAPSIRVKRNRGTKTFQFPKMSQGVAQKRSSQTMRKLMNVEHSNATATGVGWEAAELTDVFDQAETNVDEKAALAKIIAGAVNRREDQLIYDAMDVSGSVLDTITVNIGGNNTGLNVAKLRAAMAAGDADEWPDEDRHIVSHTNGKSDLLGETEVTSSDFNTVRALVKGEVDSFLGWTFHWIGNRPEGGISKTANTRANFAYHGGMMGSIGLGVVMTSETRVSWEEMWGSHLSVQDFDAGAVVIDDQGLIALDTYEA